MKKLLLSLLLIGVGFAAYCQTAASYAYSNTAATFTSINSTGTLVSGVHGDDVTATSLPIGFSFSFCGTAYTNLSACSNGWLSLSNASSPVFNNTATIAGTVSPLLMPFWDDLDGAGSSSAAYYSTTGVAPNRVFTFEWKNTSYYISMSLMASFQVKLYETSNIISYVYGPNTFGSAVSSATIGIANSATDYQTLDSGYVSTSSTSFNMSSTFPSAGNVFNWTPSSSSCSGTPSAGTSAATFTHSCATTICNLSLSGYTTGSGITYQWQSSVDGGSTWTNITGATTTTFSNTYSGCGSTMYRCHVACTSSGLSANSTTSTLAPNKFSGHINFGSAAYTDSMGLKVWLVKFNPSDSSITAVDSVSGCTDGTTQYYEFDNEPAGLYRVKARIVNDTPGTSGYIPTYSSSTPYWYAADTANHAASCDVLDINMIYGTVPSGPGFIGGYVYSGAGRATSGDIPEPNMLIFIRDASSSTILTHVYTDATGAYSFSGLANGTYTIYPEAMGYATTPSSTITVNTAHEAVNAVNFKKHTTARTVTPTTATIVNTVVDANVILKVYPNPASSVVNIDWANMANGTMNIAVYDMTGRQLITAKNEVTAPNGKVALDVNNLSSGFYFITLKGANCNYTGRLLIAK